MNETTPSREPVRAEHAPAGPALRVISSMATRELLDELLTGFRARSALPVQFEPTGGVDAARRLRAGERFDIAVLAADAIDSLIDEGVVTAASRVELVRSEVAVAVRAGSPRIDIGTADALRHAVLTAERVGYSTGPSGVALAALFERWGITAQIRDRLVVAPPGVPVGALLARGEVSLGFQQTSELMNLAGIEVLGPMPPEIRIITTFVAGQLASSPQASGARALLDHCSGPDVAEIKRRHGMIPV